MSDSFTNIQVHLGDASSDDSDSHADRIAAAIAEEAWYERVDGPEEADRTVAVDRGDESGWLSVYDSHTMYRNLDRLEARAAELSATLDRPAIAVMMHEGDVLELRLARDGALVDRMSSDPHFFGEPEETYGVDSADELRGRPDVWAEALGDDVDADALRTAWAPDGSDLDAPEVLQATAEALGWSLERAGLGYRALQQQGLGPSVAVRYIGLADTRVLGDRVEGAPSFQASGTSDPDECAVGEGRKMSLSVTNEGGATEGLVAFAWGPALERDVVEVESIELAGGSEGGRATREPTLQRDDDGETLAVATFPEKAVGAALAESDEFDELPPEARRRRSEARQAASVSVHVNVRASSNGDAALNVGLMDPEVPDDRALSTFEIGVLAEPRRPLGVRDSPDLEHALRQMQRSTSLFAVVHVDSPSRDWLRRAGEAGASWIRDIARDGGRVKTYVDARDAEGSASDSDTREDDVEAFDAASPAEWADRLEGARQYRAHGRPPASETTVLDASKPGFGFAFYRCIPARADDPEASASGVGFWVDLEHRETDDIDALERRLEAHVDRLADTPDFLQASMDRWGWTPSAGLSRLPYEMACDVRWIGDTLRSDWLRRRLRSVTRRLWLGEALLEEMELEALREVADIESVGDAHRLTLQDEAELDDLEAALEAILPTAT